MAPHGLPAGSILNGRYIIGRVLGQGGFGITYTARDHQTGQIVAVKEFFPDSMAIRSTVTEVTPFQGERGENFAYGPQAVLRSPIRSEEVPQQPLEEHPQLSQQSMLNIEHNFIPFIEAHPDTEFIFFFPPYSLMQWYSFYTQGQLHHNLMQKQAVTERLLAYDNVKLYDFQAQLDWILNLDHYVDYEHYGAHINDEIVRMITKDQCRVTGVEQIRETASVLIDHVDRLRRNGAWPDSFDSIPPIKGDH